MYFPHLPPNLPLIAQIVHVVQAKALTRNHLSQLSGVSPVTPASPPHQPPQTQAKLESASDREETPLTTLSQFRQRGISHEVSGFFTPDSQPISQTNSQLASQPDSPQDSGLDSQPDSRFNSRADSQHETRINSASEFSSIPQKQSARSGKQLTRFTNGVPTATAVRSPQITPTPTVLRTSIPTLPRPAKSNPAKSNLAGQAPSGQALPKQAPLGQALPRQAPPRQALPGQALPSQWKTEESGIKIASRSQRIPVPVPQKLVLIAQAEPSLPPPPGSPNLKPPSTPVIELKADRQDYDQERQILTAEGNVVMRYQGAILDADRVQISFLKRQAVAEGNASIVQGTKTKLFGSRLEYNYGDGSGQVFQARSEIYLKNLGPTASPTLPTDAGRSGVSDPLLSQRLILQQPLQGVTQAGQFLFGTAFGGTTAGLREGQVNLPKSGGSVNRYRLEADKIVFDDRGWAATNARLTNDPFSPPELEIRAKTARIRAIGPYEDEVLLQNDRIVFDQKTAIPLILQRYVINRRRNNPIPSLLEFGYDAQERGGFYIQRTQTLLSNSQVQWTISPQYYLQAALSPNAFRQKLGVGSQTAANGPFDPNLFGFRTDVNAALTPSTLFSGFLSLTSLNRLQDNLRARLTLRQNITEEQPNVACINRPARTAKGTLPTESTPVTSDPATSDPATSNSATSDPATSNSATPSSTTSNPAQDLHCGLYQTSGNFRVNGEYTYRDRLFNGSLGFQDVQQSFGAVVTSPTYQIDRTGINFSYQVSAQGVNADTDRINLRNPNSNNSRVSLGRFQGSAALSRFFTLTQGQALPATASEGLKYTPAPVVPYTGIYTGLTGVGTAYTSGDTQNYLQASVGFQGQLGHFSRPFADYTGFNLSFAQTFLQGSSPFLFDRVADQRYISAGVTQQLYGPVRVGAQTSINLDTGRQISTDYTLEYSRRTYSVTLRYNPVQQIGSINLIINDFNWVGGTDPFSNSEIRSVEGGIIRSRE